MGVYILYVFMMAAVPPSTAEFSGKIACESAAAEIMKHDVPDNLRIRLMMCLPKSAPVAPK